MARPKPLPHIARRRGAVNVRSTGLVIAIGLGLVSAGLILLIIVRANRAASLAASRGPVAPGGSVDKPPADVTQIGLQRGGRARVQFVDRNDPSRTSGQLEWNSLEPLEAGYSRIDKPTGTVFSRDGSIIVIKAATGRIYTPPRASEPESGSFEGQVTVERFEPGPQGTIDTEKDAPRLTFTTRTLSFDSSLGELVTRDDWTIKSAGLSAMGRGLRVIGNQVENRIESLEVARMIEVRYDPAADRAARTAAKPPVTDSASTPSGTPTAHTPKVVVYRAVLDDSVRIEQAGRWIRSDTLELLGRMVDGRLADGGLPDMPGPAAAPAPGAGTEPPAGESLVRAGDGPITVTWNGPLVVRPTEISAVSPEQSIVANFTARDGGSVTFADPGAEADGSATRLSYEVATRLLTASGPTPESVVLRLGPRSTLAAGSLTQNLGSGVGQVRGPGVITMAAVEAAPAAGAAADDGGGGPRSIRWNDQADFVFSSRGQWMTGNLSEAIFAGAVHASDGKADLRGGTVHARFTPGEGDRALLARLGVRDDAAADSGDAGSLRAQAIEVAFTPSADQLRSHPTFATATGAVTATRNGETLGADRVEATLEQDEAGKTVLASVEAEQHVVFAGRDGAAATADRMVADPRKQVVELFGPTASITSQGATVLSQWIVINGLDRRLTVPGSGVLRLVRPAETLADGRTRQPVAVETTWTRSLNIDDRLGTAVCIGDAVAVSTSNPDEIETLRAERVELAFTPFDAAAPAGDPSRGPTRRLVRAEAFGSIVDREGGRLATVESRRYFPDAGGSPVSVDAVGRRLERLLFVESARLVADETTGVIRAPQAGRLLIDDRRDVPAGADSSPRAPAALPASGTRGSTLFSWTGDAALTRAAGLAELRQGVRMIHRAAEGEPVTTLDADRAEATFRTGTNTSPDAGSGIAKGGQLVRASAFGNVTVENDRKTLQAGTLTFEAMLNQLTAEAAQGGRVVFLDPDKGTPQVARKLIWKLGANQEVRVIEPATTMPR